MRRLLALLAVVGALSLQPGCETVKWLTNKQKVEAQAAQITQLEEKLALQGQTLATAAKEDKIRVAQEVFGEEVKDVIVHPDGKVDVVLTAPALAALKEGLAKGIEKAQKATDPKDLLGALATIVLGGFGVFGRRRALEGAKA